MDAKTFKARFESMCPVCYCTIRFESLVQYVKNDVVHVRCAAKLEKQINDAINKENESKGYL